MVRQFSRTQRWIAFALLLTLGLTLFASLHLDLRSASTQLSAAGRGGDYEENEAATIREYFKYRFDQMKDKSGKIPDGALIGALNARQAMVARQTGSKQGVVTPAAAGINNMSWTFAGPGNIGGRIRAILPINASTVFIGSVAGGIWKTTNCCSSATTWTVINDFMANLAISSLIVDPIDANVMYAGTGEGFGNADGLRGAGVFKSTDGGATWSQLASTNNSDWYYVNRLAISPNGTTIIAATGAKLFRSTDGGTSWSAPFAGNFKDVKFDPSNSSNAIAAADDFPAYSTDGGATWTAATGLPASGRKELAYAPSNPAIVYVAMEPGSIYRSTNGGQTYSQVNANAGHQTNQGWYDNAIWVNPTNENHLAVGGLDLYQSTDGGGTFTKISDWEQSHPYATGAASPHADHHALVSIPGSSTALINGNDGGLYYTANIATAGNNPPTYNSGWVEMNNNLGITQYYGVAGNSNGVLYGGAQDNGVNRGTAGGPNAWTFANGGDGGKSAADPTDPNYFYNEYTFGAVSRSSNGGTNAEDIYGQYYNGTIFTCRPAPYRIDDACNQQGSFIAPILLDPNNAQRLLVGGLSLWRTNDARTPHVFNSPTGGPQWAAIKSSIGSGINAVAVAPSNSDVIWVGHQNSQIYVTTNGTGATPTWTRVDTNIGGGNPGTMVGSIAIDKNDSNIVYVGFTGFGSNRLWRTADGGTAWTNVTSNLPQAPIYAVAINPANSAWLYVGTEIGVFASENTGGTWNVPGTGMNGDGPANVAVFDLQWVNGGNSTGTNVLIAGTHGRGAWTTNISVTDTTPPTVTINQAVAQADPTSGTPINFTVVFNEAVTGFIGSDVSFTGSTVGGTLSAVVTGGPTTFNVAISGMTTSGTVIATVPANSAVDGAGNNNTASTSTDNTVTFNAADTTPPTVTINQAVAQADPTSGTPINFTVVFNEAVTGFIGSDVSFTGSTVGGTLSAVVTGGPTTFNVAISGMTTSGTVVASVPANSAVDGAGNNNTASTSTDNTVTFNAADTTPPTVTINQAVAQADPTSGTPINFTVVFNEAVTGFIGSDVSFTGSTVGGTLSAVVTGGPTTFNVAISGMTTSGTVVASVPANSAVDGAGNNNTASTSTDNTVTFNASAPGTPTIVISSDSNGSVPGLSFRDEDIMAYNPNTGLWTLVFDGSDVGLGNVDVDGFAFLSNGDLLLSVDKDFNLSGFGAVDESDILKFIPGSYGPTTSGSYVIYFDGSDVGLSSSDEDVDAIDFDASGKLLISVNGSFKAPGASGNVSGNDEDLFRLSGVTGANTTGVWDLYFDGSDVGMTSSGEDLFGLWADHANSKLYLSTHDNFSVPGASGDEDDIFVCQYSSLGATTACTFTVFWNGDHFGFDDDAIDGLSIGDPLGNGCVTTANASTIAQELSPDCLVEAESQGSVAVDDTVEYAGDDANEADPLDGEETDAEEAQNHPIFLPLIER